MACSRPIYRGLQNQGATCYMNSTIQTLFHNQQFREAVISISEENRWSPLVALKAIFVELMRKGSAGLPVQTNKLTESLGWNKKDSLIEQDPQEFLLGFFDGLRGEMIEFGIDWIVPFVFQGEMTSTISCHNKEIPYLSKKKETFLDIQLDIINMTNIYEAFDDYTKSETLETAINCGVYGSQVGEKQTRLSHFPNVLQLHLKRFKSHQIFDPRIKKLKRITIKLDSRFEFPYKLDLKDYAESDENVCDAAYTLHSVMTHSGSAASGHYMVYINTNGNGEWWQFNDTFVTACRSEEVIDNNFGGLPRKENAYFLVYIKDSMIPSVLPSTEKDRSPDKETKSRPNVESDRQPPLKKQKQEEFVLETTKNLPLEKQDSSQFWKKGLDSTRSLENRYQLKKSEKTKIEKEYKNQQAQTDLRFHEAFGAALVAASIKDSIKMTLPVDQRDAFEDMFEGLQKLKLEEKKKKKQE